MGDPERQLGVFDAADYVVDDEDDDDDASAFVAVRQSHADQLADVRFVRELLWGTGAIKADIFDRWSQGFVFSEAEPTALVQFQGGPCAVIAPVQAHVLRQLLAIDQLTVADLRDLPTERVQRALVQALCAMLAKCHSFPFNFRVMTQRRGPSTSAAAAAAEAEAGPSTSDAERFHSACHIIEFDTIEAVRDHYTGHVDELQQTGGVLQFMYSALLTKRLPAIEDELLDLTEPLIHEVYGYASQALINLMLTGRAVPNVWDNDQDIGGLMLKGIDRQSDVGFITLMEQMRYCTVGSFYKNPTCPVWLMGSETHLSVLFSGDRRLAALESASDSARRVFKSYDPDGNNFIQTAALQDVLRDLNLVSETEYVEIMQKRLDPEGLGIILQNNFMDEFYGESVERSAVPDSFELLHYNGIPGSNAHHTVRYNRGNAVLLESELKQMEQANNAVLTCLQTKWPTIDVQWVMEGDRLMPSLN